MSSQSIGTLIWTSVRPMLRLVLCASTGFIITKSDLLPPVAARGAGQIMLNIALPSLLFSKIVPAFTPENIGNLGPLVLVCLLYQLIGLLTCLVILPFFWVPHRFRWGFIAAGIWGNYGDIPTAVIMSITAASPFNGTEDQNLAVAYIAAFVLVFMITFFPMGGHYLIARDFQGHEREDVEVRLSFTRKSIRSAAYLGRLLRAATRSWRHPEPNRDIEVRAIQEKDLQTKLEERPEYNTTGVFSSLRPVSTNLISKHITSTQEDSTVAPSELDSASPASAADPGAIPSADTTPATQIYTTSHSSPTQGSLSYRLFRTTTRFLQTLLTAPTLAVISALIISVVQPLKGLFVLLPSSPKAPDGQPPLAFILDTATFLGGASVPLGLICVGSAIARLSVPRGEWHNLPIGSIIFLALGRMVLQPVLGVLIVRGLTHVGVISADDKVLQFVCIFFSCVPTATTQVFVTQVYSGTGSAEHLSAFLIPQYALMFITSTILTAYSLHLLFG